MNRINRRGLFSIVVICVALLSLVGCADQGEEIEQEERRIAIEPVEAVTIKLEETVSAIGSIEATEEVMIRPELSGRIERIKFAEGSWIEKDQPLYEIEAVELREEVEALKSSLHAARVSRETTEKDYQRMKNLFQRGLTPAQQFEQAEQQYQTAKSRVDELSARLRQAQKRYSDSIIISPLEGYVSEILVDTGNFVGSGDELAVIYRSRRPEISFTVPERHSNRVDSGQLVRVRTAALPGRQLEGRVNFVSPVISPGSRSLLVKALLQENDLLLRPGGFSHVELVLAERPQRPVIPEEALVATREGHMVFVVEDETAHSREVEVGMRIPGKAEIVSGLEIGEIVVRTGHMNLRDGSPVRSVQGEGEQLQ